MLEASVNNSNGYESIGVYCDGIRYVCEYSINTWKDMSIHIYINIYFQSYFDLIEVGVMNQ